MEILIIDLTKTLRLICREQIFTWILISSLKFEYLAILHLTFMFNTKGYLYIKKRAAWNISNILISL